MSILKKAELVMERLTRYAAYIGAAALVFNIVVVIAYVVSRALDHAIVGTEECVAMGQVVLIAMALGYTHHNQGLIHVGFFMKKLPGPGSMIAWVLDNWISVIICFLWVYQSILRYPVVRQTSQILAIPFKPLFLVMTIGVVLYAISQLFEAIKCTIGIFNAQIRQEIKDNWPS